MSATTILEHLKQARRVADHAGRLGAHDRPDAKRIVSGHIGAVLADAVLQAGVSYRNVVQARVERIEACFPEAATLAGVMALVDGDAVEDFLRWSHRTKIDRFTSLTRLLAAEGVETTDELRAWLCRNDARARLLALPGIGPKTCDYLCFLVGIDCVAIDRHVKAFASEAGVPIEDYDGLKSVVSYAADLLGIARSDFDAWIWHTVSSRRENEEMRFSM